MTRLPQHRAVERVTGRDTQDRRQLGIPDGPSGFARRWSDPGQSLLNFQIQKRKMIFATYSQKVTKLALKEVWDVQTYLG